jgi:hypothetical protein
MVGEFRPAILTWVAVATRQIMQQVTDANDSVVCDHGAHDLGLGAYTGCVG